MAVRITVSYESLEQAYNKFNACKEALASAYSKMKSAMEQVDSAWNGDASEAYVAKFNAIHGNLQTSDPTVEDAMKDLQTAINAYRNVEDEIAASIQNAEEVTSPFNG